MIDKLLFDVSRLLERRFLRPPIVYVHPSGAANGQPPKGANEVALTHFLLRIILIQDDLIEAQQETVYYQKERGKALTETVKYLSRKSDTLHFSMELLNSVMKSAVSEASFYKRQADTESMRYSNLLGQFLEEKKRSLLSEIHV